jgi:hypothetical protein
VVRDFSAAMALGATMRGRPIFRRLIRGFLGYGLRTIGIEEVLLPGSLRQLLTPRADGRLRVTVDLATNAWNFLVIGPKSAPEKGDEPGS